MALEEPMLTQRRLRTLSTALCVLFAVSGIAKVGGFPSQVQLFEAFGFPAWARLAVGCAELVFASLLLMPPTRGWGGVGVVVLMAGAVVSRAVRGVQLPMMFVDALILTGGVWVVLKARPALLAIHWPDEHPKGV